ncbi:Crp/Fnr family transcriptional regulator [Nocardia asteroides]|uniref:Crp/Fnr family transcriptional regulator n=1 Tax=Nocardia asteroides TaxID=1824 RepID=UPI001E537255|nr:Crp/Fnr family transcriptional regulator [Nocardia asteroides]UGT59298.1 Crp/Fnr family transcriptional regulator [Nocardia asteroides]
MGTFMARLTPTSRKDLLGLARGNLVRAGTILIRQGDQRRHVDLLRSGSRTQSACVKVTATARNGNESLLGIRVGGDVIGELAALQGTQRSATVTTCTEALVHSITHSDFLAFLRDHPEGWEAMCRMIAGRLEWANQRRLDFAGYDVPQRLARILLELTALHGVRTGAGWELGVRLSQVEFGRLIGAKEDAASSAMRKLRSDGLVRSAYRSVLITDLEGLKLFADAP